MRGHRGYNICPWLKNGKHEICGKSCREEYCKNHRNSIRNGSRIPRPCLKCGIGVRSQIQLCRGCGREKERQRLAKTRVEPAQHRVSAGVRDKCDTVYFTENEFCFGLRDWTKLKLCLCVYRVWGKELDTTMSGLRAIKRKTKTLLFQYFIADLKPI